MGQKEKENIVEQITQLFDNNETLTKDRIEVIANVLIREGVRLLPDQYATENLSQVNLMTTIMDVKKEQGETLATALIQQGSVMLMWLGK
jgi:hypothetical protein